MSAAEKIRHELAAVLLVTSYFFAWLGILMVMKNLILAEHHIALQGFSMALVGSLILSKVVLILEHVPFGSWVRNQPAWVDVALRTLLYSAGVLIVMVLEKGFEGRHGEGGFGGAVSSAFRSADAPHIWLNTICLAGALLVYNIAAVVRHHLGKGGLRRLFLRPLPDETTIA